MEFLAQNAVGRVINYLQSLKDGMQEEDPERFLENFHTLITKGIVLGNSDKVKLLFIFKDTKEKFNVEAMYAQVGLVRVTDGNGANEYYTKGGATDVEKYGYRAMFEWELENVQKDIWEKEKNPPKIQYEYTLKPEKIEENVKQILKEINEGDKVLKRDIVDLKSICKDNNRLLSIQQTGLELGKFTIALDLILRSAIEDNKLEEVEYLLGLYKKYFNYKIENSNRGYNSLQSSAQCDSIKLFKHLIEKESYDYKIEFDDEEGYNLLQLAAENDSIRVFEYLTGIEWFSCKIKDDRKYNLLLITAKYDSVRILRYLKGKGFSHEIENDGGV